MLSKAPFLWLIWVGIEVMVRLNYFRQDCPQSMSLFHILPFLLTLELRLDLPCMQGRSEQNSVKGNESCENERTFTWTCRHLLLQMPSHNYHRTEPFVLMYPCIYLGQIISCWKGRSDKWKCLKDFKRCIEYS